MPTAEKNLNRYEAILQSFSMATMGHPSSLAAASQQTRLESNAKSAREAEIVSVSAGVAGPVLVSFVLWTLQQAFALGLERLYFISRDGEILLQMAQRLLPAFWPERKLELRYLLGSRQAWHLPSLSVSQHATNDWLLFFFETSSLKTIFSRVELTLADCQDRLAAHGFSADEWERKLSSADRPAVEGLMQDPVIQERIQQRARDAMKPVLGYLEQEGLFENTCYGLVDFAWTGRTKGSLEKLLRLRGKEAPPFFTFGRNGEQSQEDSTVLHAYLFNLQQNVGNDRYMPAIEALMEVFCTGLTSGLRCYQQQDDGSYGPVYREANPRPVEAWGYQFMRDSILHFTGQFAANAAPQKSPPVLPPEASAALLQSFWLSPTWAEAGAWGPFPFEEDQGGGTHLHLIPPVQLSPRLFWRLLRNGRGFDQRAVWQHGIAVLHSRPVGFAWLLVYRIRETLYKLKWSVSRVRS